ncbi:MAG TPA: response regulator transcription factor [Solirubrobacterales bacterium]
MIPKSASSRSSPALAVAIVDGDPLWRHALRMRLAAEGDIELVGEAPDASTGIELVRDQRPDLVLLELALPDRSGGDAMREILTISPEIRVIMLAAEADETTQLQALQAGAAGFLLKSIDLDILPRVLRGVREGEAAVSRSVAMRLVEEVQAREG